MLDNASYYGRIFARSGGLSDAVVEALKEQNNEDFKLNAIACDGMTHGEKNKADVDKYGKQAMEKTILDAISVTDVGPEAE